MFLTNSLERWYVNDETHKTQGSKGILTLQSESTWSPPKGSPPLELFLNKTEQNHISVLPGKTKQFNLTRKEYLSMRNLQGDITFVIKSTDKGSAVVTWDPNHYLKEAQKQFCDESTYLQTKVIEKDQVSLVEQSNRK